MFKERKGIILLNVLIIISLSLAVRMAYSNIKPALAVFPDSYGYYGLGTQMVSSPKFSTIITPFRTPLYPFVVGITALFVGKLGTPIESPDFATVGSGIIAVQTCVGIATLLLLYLGLSRIDKNRWRTTLITLFFAFDPMLLAFERTMMTETITVFLAVLATYAALKLLIKPTGIGFLLFLTASVLGFLTRPAFLAIPLVAVPFLFWVFLIKKNRTALGLLVVTTLLYVLVPISYGKMNDSLHGYKGIQEVSGIDMLGRILEFRIPPDAGYNIGFLYTEVQKQQAFGGPTMPFEFINSFDPTLYAYMEKMNDLDIFVRQVVKANFVTYALHAVSYSPRMFSDVSTATLIPDQTPFEVKMLFQTLWHLYRISQYPSVLALFVFPFILFLFFKHPTMKRTVVALCLSIVIIQTLLTVFVVYYEDYGRLALIFRPHLFIPFFYIAGKCAEKAFLFFKEIIKEKSVLL